MALIGLLFPVSAFASGALPDLAPAMLVMPALFGVILFLALVIAFIGPGHARTRRSLALLIVLVAAFGILMSILPLPIGSGLSLAVFIGIFAVIYLMGRFDSPE